MDLNKIETYGFRGEALAALCSVSELSVTTKTTDENFGFTYTFDQNGNVLTTKPCPCNQGSAILFFKNSYFYNILCNQFKFNLLLKCILINSVYIDITFKFKLSHWYLEEN